MFQTDIAKEFFTPAPFKLYYSEVDDAVVLRTASIDGRLAYLLVRTPQGMQLYHFDGLMCHYSRLDLPQSNFVQLDDERKGWIVYLHHDGVDEVVFPASHRQAPFMVFRRGHDDDPEARPIRRLWQGMPTDYGIVAVGVDKLTAHETSSAVGVPDLVQLQRTLRLFGECESDAWQVGLDRQTMTRATSRLGDMIGYLIQMTNPEEAADTAEVPSSLLSYARIVLDTVRPDGVRRTDLPDDYNQQMLLGQRIKVVLLGLTEAIMAKRRIKRS